ncbi:hypothetical protein BCF46_2177 [Litoreibacter meonggei]|uniref:Uncharacterized protein n=1 Tax=Litoreibacter meonggei TaxID=1049199 RepID=A0A497W7J3_9RHOB|nr:hypothetical protein [Litoreibacter meonggei]RLJ51952.1 hypothetical protein BCF46_2177 [Litoreibacter meonggei]
MEHYQIKKMKTLGKRYARATAMAHTDALNILAMEFGFAHWKSLTDAVKEDWQPSEEALAQVEEFVRKAGAKTDARNDASHYHEPEPENGELCGHQFQIGSYLGDVIVSGNGWELCIPEAPLKAPIVEIDKRHAETSPVKDPRFLAELIEIAEDRSKRIRAQMAVDWPRRSTKADIDGIARHPLRGREASTWYCHSCDAQITGSQLAKNYWHCPNCGTHPLNIHAEPVDGQFPGEPVETPEAAERENPEVRIVEPRLTLHLNEETVSTLIRCALLEDAASVNERLGAMRADISLLDGEEVWITFDEMLWPEDKEPNSALAVAKKLGLEVAQEVSLFTEPFAWPDLGHMTSDTADFTETLLKAYENHGVIKR